MILILFLLIMMTITFFIATETYKPPSAKMYCVDTGDVSTLRPGDPNTRVFTKRLENVHYQTVLFDTDGGDPYGKCDSSHVRLAYPPGGCIGCSFKDGESILCDDHPEHIARKCHDKYGGDIQSTYYAF